MSRDEHGGDRQTSPEELAMELEPAQVRQPNVEDEARGHVGASTVQKLVGGPERLRSKPDGIEKSRDRVPNRPIVVDDEHDGRVRRHGVGSLWTGTMNWNVAPTVAFEVAHKCPPCASMADRLIDSPIPRPSGFIV